MEDRPHPLVFRGESEMMSVRTFVRSLVLLPGAAILLVSLSTTQGFLSAALLTVWNI